MLVSIIIPSHRQPQFLERAIRSCLEQDHHELEVIVVDDHSQDASLGIAVACARADSRVRVVACPTNGGLGWARNVGIAHARGEYLCFLDSDDYLLDRSISARLLALSNATAEYGDSLVGVYGDWQHVAESIDNPIVRQPRPSMPVVSRETYTGENVFICSAPLVRRDAVLAAGGFPEGLPMLEDFAMWAKIIAAGGVFAPVHHVVSTYRQRPNSMLRGDGLVIMADHVDVINDWVERQGTSLADGGALAAWLNGGDPRSFGRMSWSVPSVLGSAGGGSTAAALHVLDEVDVQRPNSIDDFMGKSVTDGITNPPPVWDLGHTQMSDTDAVLLVRTLPDSLAAISLVKAAPESSPVTVAVEDPTSFEDTWPLALAGIVPMSFEDLQAASPTPSEVATAVGDVRAFQAAVMDALSLLWPETVVPAGSAVYVSDSIADHPALDAWLSTALHSLAELGLEPTIVADPRARAFLGGYRSSVFSVDTVKAVSVLVVPTCDEAEFLSWLTETVVFDPFTTATADARTKSELDQAIRDVGKFTNSA